MKVIEIHKDFSEYPGLRNCSLSDKSGEEFYHTMLNFSFYDAISSDEKLIVDLDLTSGYASSFLDEAFGNLVYDFTKELVMQYLDIISLEEPHWKDMLINKTFIEWEKRRLEGNSPKVYIIHTPWYRYRNNKFELGVWENPDV
ncbi:STAS-like domain-containing protein [Chryseobacterium sp. 2TAF14]|uniref:STAS-like domain-containing protein n=1 Tax=Chryseobacterium sp. 2TAF14 TaxID=3233007 RepID=UPI003F8EB14F